MLSFSFLTDMHVVEQSSILIVVDTEHSILAVPTTRVPHTIGSACPRAKLVSPHISHIFFGLFRTVRHRICDRLAVV